MKQGFSFRIHSPVGDIFAQGYDEALHYLTILDHEYEENTHHPIAKIFQRYFDSEGTLDDIQISLEHCSTFERQVLESCRSVPLGETISYQELAHKSQYIGAARAVGTCMRKNPLPLVIPCHRIIRSDGSLGNYVFGQKKKYWLLEHEKRGV